MKLNNMTNETLVFDIGQNIVGIYSVEDGKYTAYMGGEMVVGA